MNKQAMFIARGMHQSLNVETCCGIVQTGIFCLALAVSRLQTEATGIGLKHLKKVTGRRFGFSYYYHYTEVISIILQKKHSLIIFSK